MAAVPLDDLLPIVQLLANCQTDAGRADWLLRVPQAIVSRDYSAIRRVLLEACFAAGVDALDMEFAALCATCLPDGGLPHEIALGVHVARSLLREVVRKGSGCEGSGR